MDTQLIIFSILLVSNSVTLTAVFLRSLHKNKEDLKDYINQMIKEVRGEYVKEKTCLERRGSCKALNEIEYLKERMRGK